MIGDRDVAFHREHGDLVVRGVLDPETVGELPRIPPGATRQVSPATDAAALAPRT